MYENAVEKIESIISNGYDFKFGDYIGRGFDIAKKNWGGFVGFLLLTGLVSGVISLIPKVGQIINALVLSPVLTVGFYIVANKLWKNQESEFGDFFKGFDDVGQIALTAVVQYAIILGSLIPFYFFVKDTGMVEWYFEYLADPIGMQGTEPPLPAAWTFLLTLPAIFLGVAYSWSYMFVVFFKMGYWDAMEASRKMVSQKWFVVFGFYIVVGLIAAAGIIALCIGLLFTVPAMYCMVYAAFEDVTQLNAEEEEGGNIEKHLIV